MRSAARRARRIVVKVGSSILTAAGAVRPRVFTELIRGDIFFWQGLMAATLIPSIPLALLCNLFLDRFIAGFTGGAFR